VTESLDDLGVWGYQNFKKLGNFLPGIIDRRNRPALISSRGEDGTLGRVMHRRAGEKACGATFVCTSSHFDRRIGLQHLDANWPTVSCLCCAGSLLGLLLCLDLCSTFLIVQARITDSLCGWGDIRKAAGPASCCSPYSPGCN